MGLILSCLLFTCPLLSGFSASPRSFPFLTWCYCVSPYNFCHTLLSLTDNFQTFYTCSFHISLLFPSNSSLKTSQTLSIPILLLPPFLLLPTSVRPTSPHLSYPFHRIPAPISGYPISLHLATHPRLCFTCFIQPKFTPSSPISQLLIRHYLLVFSHCLSSTAVTDILV